MSIFFVWMGKACRTHRELSTSSRSMSVHTCSGHLNPFSIDRASCQMSAAGCPGALSAASSDASSSLPQGLRTGFPKTADGLVIFLKYCAGTRTDLKSHQQANAHMKKRPEESCQIWKLSSSSTCAAVAILARALGLQPLQISP